MLIFENLNFNHPPLPRIQKIKLIIPLSSEVDLEKKPTQHQKPLGTLVKMINE